ncbi:MAG: hypothetical protein QOK47_654, partial [Actinomycetota bacterium]|nr:hypothetical protein [Actinomycetota bacterium]
MRRRALIVFVCYALTACSAAPADHVVVTSSERRQQLEWKRLAPVPTPRTEVAAAALAHEIYVIGG